MCTEFFLAILYFITIFIVNYFLFRLLKEYFLNILYLLKLKNIFKKVSKNNIQNISLLYFFSKTNFQKTNFFSLLNKFSNSTDILVLGKNYQYLVTNIEKKNGNQLSLLYYFGLLKDQYMSVKKEKIK